MCTMQCFIFVSAVFDAEDRRVGFHCKHILLSMISSYIDCATLERP